MKIKTIMSPGIGFGTIKVYERGKELDYDDRKFIILTDEDLIASDTMGY